jgi:predicted RNA-binding Zn-ribbon protein involved in translation (DUF1610 family)
MEKIEMTVIETKFSIGDVVYHAWTESERRHHPCPDCLGVRKWKAVSPAGTEYEFGCPRCGGQYLSDGDLDLSYSVFAPRASKMTIGSVRTDTHSKEGNEYMCLETGVGSGSIYREPRLFHAEAEALAAAEVMAANQNTTTEWVVKQYDKTLSLCDYEMGEAKMKAADALSQKLRWGVSDLFGKLRDAEDIKEAHEIIERFEFPA